MIQIKNSDVFLKDSDTVERRINILENRQIENV